MRPVIGGSIFGPEFDEDIQVFIGDASACFVRGGMQGLKLLLVPASADPHDQAPTRQDIEIAEHFGGEVRVPVGDHQDRQAESWGVHLGGDKG